METFQKGTKVLKYEVIYKPIKNAYFRPKDGYLQITVNKLLNNKELFKTIDENFDKFYDLVNKKEEPKPLTLWGKELKIIQLPAKTFSYFYDAKKIVINSSHPLEKIWMRVLEEECKYMYESLVDVIRPKINQHGLDLVKVGFRFMKSKYGSCNTVNREIVLNTFLAKIDPIYYKYVLYHEYTHLIVPNHQPEFYQVLDSFMINHKELQKQLKKIAIY